MLEEINFSQVKGELLRNMAFEDVLFACFWTKPQPVVEHWLWAEVVLFQEEKKPFVTVQQLKVGF